MKAEVRPYNGTPTLFLDGQPRFADIQWVGHLEATGMELTQDAIRAFARSNVHIYTTDALANEWCGPRPGDPREFDFSTRFIELAGEVNTAMPYHVVEAIGTALNEHKKSLKGAKLLILGVAYKKDVDDLRESPTLKIMQLLQQRGAHLEYNDPYFPQLHKMRHYNYENMKSVPMDSQTLGSYDAVIIATDHSIYDYVAIVDAAKLVVDTRNATRRVIRHRSKIVLC